MIPFQICFKFADNEDTDQPVYPLNSLMLYVLVNRYGHVDIGNLDEAYFVYILSLVTDNNPS